MALSHRADVRVIAWFCIVGQWSVSEFTHARVYTLHVSTNSQPVNTVYMYRSFFSRETILADFGIIL